MTIIANRVERARFDVDRVHFRTRPVLMPGYYAIIGSGELQYNLWGYRWTGPPFPYWESCPEIAQGLTIPGGDYWTHPTVWYSGTWNLIYTKSWIVAPWDWHGFTWHYTKWVQNDALVEGEVKYCPEKDGQPMDCWYSNPEVFWLDNTLYLIYNVSWCNASCWRPWFGFIWEDNEWKTYSEIVEGLPWCECIQGFDTLWWDGTLWMLTGPEFTGYGDVVRMFYWDEDTEKWVRDESREVGLWSHGGGGLEDYSGFGLFEIEGEVYAFRGRYYYVDAKVWVDDHWEYSPAGDGLPCVEHGCLKFGFFRVM